MKLVLLVPSLGLVIAIRNEDCSSNRGHHGVHECGEHSHPKAADDEAVYHFGDQKQASAVDHKIEQAKGEDTSWQRNKAKDGPQYGVDDAHCHSGDDGGLPRVDLDVVAKNYGQQHQSTGGYCPLDEEFHWLCLSGRECLTVVCGSPQIVGGSQSTYRSPSTDCLVANASASSLPLASVGFLRLPSPSLERELTRFRVRGRDLHTAHRLAEEIEAGMVGINHFGVSQPEMPFGGWKESGIGQEMGAEGLLHYTEVKTVLVGVPR